MAKLPWGCPGGGEAPIGEGSRAWWYLQRLLKGV